MKKLNFLVFALSTVLACVSFTSCSDDDDEISNDSIVGKWIEKVVDEEETYENIYIFNEDGTGTALWEGIHANEFHYVYTKPSLTMKWSYGETEILTVEWKNSNTIRLYNKDGEDFILTRQ